jgi:hypothetical protein
VQAIVCPDKSSRYIPDRRDHLDPYLPLDNRKMRWRLAHVGVGNFLLLERGSDRRHKPESAGGRQDIRCETQATQGTDHETTHQSNQSDRSRRGKSVPLAGATSLVQYCEVLFECIDSLIGRSELEVFARRSMIPLIDIGMDV